MLAPYSSKPAGHGGRQSVQRPAVVARAVEAHPPLEIGERQREAGHRLALQCVRQAGRGFARVRGGRHRRERFIFDHICQD
jgi:hypothetical protein